MENETKKPVGVAGEWDGDKGDEMPWCGDCGSYHHPKNPTCRKLWPTEYTLLAAGTGMYLAEDHWHSPRDGQRGPMRSAWVWVGVDLLKALREKGVDTGGPWHAGGWMTMRMTGNLLS
jgi:hypothetical protein